MHYFEYKRVRFNETAYMFAMTLVLMYIFMLDIFLTKDEIGTNISTYQRHMDICFDDRPRTFFYLTYSLIFGCGFVQFEYLLIVTAVVKLKSTQDILQGLNKLDSLIKISRYQIYKQLPMKTNNLPSVLSTTPAYNNRDAAKSN